VDSHHEELDLLLEVSELVAWFALVRGLVGVVLLGLLMPEPVLHFHRRLAVDAVVRFVVFGLVLFFIF